MELRPYQNQARSAIEEEWSEGRRKTLLVLPTGCHEPNQGIMMSDGRIKTASDIKVGDRLMGSDGTPRTVLSLHSGEDDMYEVTPVIGNAFVVNSEHMLTLVQTNTNASPSYPSEMIGGTLSDVKVKTWLEWSKWKKHIHKLIRSECIEAFEGNDGSLAEVDPYFLGVLLGDGDIKNSMSVTTMDTVIKDEIVRQAEAYGMSTRSEKAGKADTIFLNGGEKGRNGSKLRNQLRNLGLCGMGSGDKHVPSIYKTLPLRMRLEVIAGLIDTDGSLTTGGYDFVSKSEMLAKDLTFMCRSVGLAAYVKPCTKTIKSIGFSGRYWRVSISGDCAIIPCRVKMCGNRNQKKSVLRTGFGISPKGRGRYVGFTVDGDNRYLLDDFTITHNCGKTIVFSMVAKDEVDRGKRVLIMAHRGELLDQAADKLYRTTGLQASVEKAEQTSLGSWYRVTVGSVQTLMRPNRLRQFAPDYFDTIIVDEAHHALSDSYQTVLNHFNRSNVLGVTATADRSDKRNLGEYFDSIAYEYTLHRAIKEGYLCPIKAQTVPISLDLRAVKISSGDFSVGDIDTALDPFLDKIADEMIAAGCMDRKTVVFLPLIATSKKFASILASKGFQSAEVNGESKDRDDILASFDAAGSGSVLCNSMLLTEGWDCPSVDCIVVLRPTKIRSLYCLDEKTEVLTRDGWKTDVQVGEDVLAFDTETDKTMFVPALGKIRRPLEPDEFFCSVKGPSIDIRVTNHHRVVYDNKRRKGWKIKEAQDIACMTGGGVYIPACGDGDFPGVSLSNAELTFIGWVMTDGSINKSNGQITITQGEQQTDYCGEIDRCLKACNFKFTKSKFTRTNIHWNAHGDCVRWTISKGAPRGTDKDKEGWVRLEPWLSKDLSPKLFDMTAEQFSVMLEAINHGDGHKNPWVSYHIGKGNKTFIERLQMMAIQRGYRASIAVEKANKVRMCDLWTLHIKKQKFVTCGGSGHSEWVKEEHSNETCWCVQNELGTLVTRRNGKVSIVGNCQMVGRGTRLSPETGKEDLLVLDFLWMTERHDLCHPAHLIAQNDEVANAMTQRIENYPGMADLEEVEHLANQDVVAQREASLADELKAMKNRKRKLVDPLQFEMSIQAEDLVSWEPTFGWEMAPASDKQIAALEKFGIFPDEVECAGKASLLLDRLNKRKAEGYATPRQIRLLESRGFQHVGEWEFTQANKMISRISANRWRTPASVDPSTYDPKEQR